MSRKLLIICLSVLLGIAWLYLLKDSISEQRETAMLKSYIAENEKKGLYKNVATAYEKLLLLDDSQKNYHALAESYRKLKKEDAYEEALEKEIAAYPDKTEAYCALLEFYQEKKDFRSAIELYKGIPENIRQEAEIQKAYAASKYAYTFLSSSYSQISSMINGNSVFFNGSGYGFINKSGNIFLDARFQGASIFTSGKTGANIGGKWYVIDQEGDKVGTSDDTFSYIGSFSSEGLAPACLNGTYGYVDTALNKTDFAYEYAGNFANGVAAVKKGGKWALLDEELKPVTKFIYDDIKLEDGFCSMFGFVFAKKDGSYILLDTEGEQIGKERFEDAKLFASQQPAAVKQNGSWGFVDIEGKLVIKPQFEDAWSFSLHMAPVKKGNVYSYIDEKEKVLITTQFSDARPFNDNGVSIVKNGDTYRLIQLLEYES